MKSIESIWEVVVVDVKVDVKGSSSRCIPIKDYKFLFSIV